MAASPDMEVIGEVSVRILSRETSAVLERVRDHERIIVTRHGHPIAVLMSVRACIDFMAAEEGVLPRRREQRAQTKRELMARLLGPEIADEAAERGLRRVERFLSPLPAAVRGFHSG
jgi:prevent-host-death family protein